MEEYNVGFRSTVGITSSMRMDQYQPYRISLTDRDGRRVEAYLSNDQLHMCFMEYIKRNPAQAEIDIRKYIYGFSTEQNCKKEVEEVKQKSLKSLLL